MWLGRAQAIQMVQTNEYLVTSPRLSGEIMVGGH